MNHPKRTSTSEPPQTTQTNNLTAQTRNNTKWNGIQSLLLNIDSIFNAQNEHARNQLNPANSTTHKPYTSEVNRPVSIIIHSLSLPLIDQRIASCTIVMLHRTKAPGVPQTLCDHLYSYSFLFAPIALAPHALSAALWRRSDSNMSVCRFDRCTFASRAWC